MRREVWREYLAGALWVIPGIFGVAAIVAGYALSSIDVRPGSTLAPLAFQGTADDARSLLAGISGTVVTVIALVLGLTVVALQLSSTQFSPRLLRNFLRDRPNQVVLGVYVATFAYSTAGLFTVGLSSGERSQQYPRLAVSGALALLFASLAMVVYFADHLAHSIQVDAIMDRVVRTVLGVLGKENTSQVDVDPPAPPASAVVVTAAQSGYVQTVHPELMLPLAVDRQLSVVFRRPVGDHIVQGTALAWVWSDSTRGPVAVAPEVAAATRRAVRIGFERTFEQDAGLGLRQLVDIACKALSPGINDPYTAVQAVARLSVIFATLAARPVGPHAIRQATSCIVVPAPLFGEHLSLACGLIRRYATSEPTVLLALLQLLSVCAEVLTDLEPARRSVIAGEADLILRDAERDVAQPADVAELRRAVAALHAHLDPR